MRGIKTILMIPVAAVLLLAGACTSSDYDDWDSAHVVLEIISFTNPPVTAAVSTTGFCSTSTAIGCTVDTDCPAKHYQDSYPTGRNQLNHGNEP